MKSGEAGEGKERGEEDSTVDMGGLAENIANTKDLDARVRGLQIP